MFKVLIPEDIAESGKEYLRSRGYALKIGITTDTNNLIKEIADVDGIIVRNAKYPKEVLEAAKKLKVLARHGTGTDNIAVQDAERLGIQVTNGPTANINAVAEYTLSLVAALSTGLVRSNEMTRAGDWTYRLKMQRSEMAEKTLGLIGFGRIGRLVAQKATNGFGMNVIAYDLFKPESLPERVEHTSDLDYVLSKSDYVSIHMPCTEKTKGMFNHSLISKMKRSAYLINCARGEICNEADLIKALNNGVIAGAALDVFEHEPLGDSPLLRMDQVILSQHNAGLSLEANDKMSLYAAMGVDEVLTGKKPSWPVNNPTR